MSEMTWRESADELRDRLTAVYREEREIKRLLSDAEEHGQQPLFEEVTP